MVSIMNEVSILPVRPHCSRNSGFMAFTSQDKIPEKQEPLKPEKENFLKKTVLPASVIGGGAVLLYLGLRKPNISKKIYNLYNQKVSEISNEVVKYKAYATEYLNKEYKNITPYIDKYKEEHAFDYLEYTAKIQDSQTGQEVLGVFDDAFSAINTIRSKDMKYGVSGMDEFRNYMYNLNHPAYQSLTTVRTGANLKLLDYSLMPRFKNGKNNELMITLEERLGEIKGRADERLFDIQNNLTDEHINQSSKLMASNIMKVRRNLYNSSSTIINHAFNKIGKMYNLGDDFKPLSQTGRSMKNFALLSPESLKPQVLSENLSGIIGNQYINKVLETVDFNQLDEKTIKTLFDGIPTTFDTKQMDMITDRLRLQQAVNKAQGAAEDSELQTAAGKLEFLASELEAYGKANLIERCSQDFSGIKPQQLHAKLYYINSTARKIGLAGLEDTDKFMINEHPQYLDSTFKQQVREVLAHPEHYFM